MNIARSAAIVRILGSGVFAAASCGGGAPSPEPNDDASTPTDAAGDVKPPPVREWVVVTDSNSDCLPRNLPVESDGRAACFLLSVFPEGTACESAKGLSPADASLAASLGDVLKNTSPLGSSTVCVASQLGTADLVGADCVAAAKAGWCLTQRTDAGICRQAIHRSPTLAVPAGGRGYVTCSMGSFPPDLKASPNTE